MRELAARQARPPDVISSGWQRCDGRIAGLAWSFACVASHNGLFLRRDAPQPVPDLRSHAERLARLSLRAIRSLDDFRFRGGSSARWLTMGSSAPTCRTRPGTATRGNGSSSLIRHARRSCAPLSPRSSPLGLSPIWSPASGNCRVNFWTRGSSMARWTWPRILPSLCQCW